MPASKSRLSSPGNRSRKMRANDTEETRKTCISKFKRLKRPVEVSTLDRVDGSGNAGVFDLVSDDAIVRIVELLMFLPCTTVASVHPVAEESRRNTVSFVLCCKRFHSILQTVAVSQQAELHARAATSIVPVAPWLPGSYTRQLEDELKSCDQIKTLKRAQDAMALHCARACCLRTQKAFNRELSKRSAVPTATLVPASESCSVFASARDSSVAFVYRRRRLSKVAVHGEDRAKRFEDEMVRLEIEGDRPRVTAALSLNLQDVSAPLFVRSSPTGERAVWISAKHDMGEDADEPTAFSVVNVWDGLETSTLDQPLESTCMSAQDAWFVRADDDSEMLAVAWSSDFLHPSGHRVGSNATADGPCYVFCTYSFSSDGTPVLCNQGMLCTEGALVSVSPSRTGREAIALVKKKNGVTPSRRITVLHDVVEERFLHIKNCSVMRGPLCCTFSPSGDCVATLCRTHNALEVQVSVRTNETVFTPVQTFDVTHFLALVPAEEDKDEFPTPDLVKAPYFLSFSPCGRFVVVHDQKPLFGERATNHGLVVLDTSLRLSQKRSLRPLPLFATAEQAPRSMEWRSNGIFVAAAGTDSYGSVSSRGGLIFLKH